MRVAKINNVAPKPPKPLNPIKQKKDDLLLRCNELRYKRFKDLTVKDAPIAGAVVGLFSPIPFGFLIGYGLGKLIEFVVNLFKR